MITFLEGPAAGQSLQLRRAPNYLRVVKSQAGEWDALDQLNDTPKPREQIFVYRLMTKPSSYHIKCSRWGGSGFFVSARYTFLADQPDEATLRDTAKWRAWATSQPVPEVT